MFTSKRSAMRLFEIQAKYTCATLSCFSDSTVHKIPVDGFRTTAELAIHCIFIRESSLASILQEESTLKSLKTRFPEGEIVKPSSKSLKLTEILDLTKESLEIFHAGLEKIDWGELDKPFKTHFNNLSISRNYLTLILQEEIHHRGQMILIARLFGLTPPEAPYTELAQMGVEQEQ